MKMWPYKRQAPSYTCYQGSPSAMKIWPYKREAHSCTCYQGSPSAMKIWLYKREVPSLSVDNLVVDVCILLHNVYFSASEIWPYNWDDLS